MDFRMKCRNIQKKLSAYQDRELKPEEKEQISRHLENCQSCREQYEKLERVWQTLEEFQEIRPDPWFYPQLVRKVKEPRERSLLPGVQWVFQMLRTPAIASILLAIGILAGTYLGNTLARSDFLRFQPERPTYSQEALFDSLKVFDPAPPGTLAHGYLQMVSYKEDDSR
jgi:predicted anti-sigma-YlaC factor YlaD